MALLVTVALGLTQCAPVPSLHPLYTNEDADEVVSNDGLLGLWTLVNPVYPDASALSVYIKESPQISEYPSKASYVVVWSEPGQHERGSGVQLPTSRRSELRLVRLQQFLFADMKAPNLPDSGLGSTYPPPHELHVFGRVEIDPKLTVFRLMVEGEAVRKMLAEHSSDGILNAHSAVLQQFALSHARDRGVFGASFYLCRQWADCALEVRARFAADNPEDSNTMCLLAAVYAERGRFDDARAVWDRTARLPAPSALTAAIFAQALMQRGRTHDAIAVLKETAARNSRDRSASFILGDAYLAADSPELAVSSLKKGLELDPNDQGPERKVEIARLLYATDGAYLAPKLALGLAYLETGNFKGAHSLFQQYVTGPDRWRSDVLSNSYSGLSDFVEGKYEAAAKEFEPESTRRDPDDLLWRYLSLRHLGSKEADKALDHYRDEIAASGDSGARDRAERWIEYLRGKLDDTEFLGAIGAPGAEWGPEDRGLSYILMAEQHLLKGDRVKAAGFYRKAFDAAPFPFGARDAVRLHAKESSAANDIIYNGRLFYVHVVARARIRQLNGTQPKAHDTP